jgi:multidrug efflux pump subunit AcrA (membrane-fusion protein)
MYLPDKSRSYAIDPSSHWSSYTFLVARDEKGLLSAIEFKASTTAVGQQLAQSAGAAAAQAYNLRTAQLVAAQTQVNTAQAAVDTAQAATDAARAQLDSDLATGAAPAAIAADRAALAQAEAKLAVARQALQRAQTTSQAVSTSISAGSVATTSGPTMGTSFTNPAWPPPTVYNLPEKFGPVLFAINDSGTSVELKAVTAHMPGSRLAQPAELREGVVGAAQPTFETVLAALPAPILAPLEHSVSRASKMVTFAFDRAIADIATAEVTGDTNARTDVTAALAEGKRTLNVDVSTLAPGTYRLSVTFTYPVDNRGHVMTATKNVKLTVTK